MTFPVSLVSNSLVLWYFPMLPWFSNGLTKTYTSWHVFFSWRLEHLFSRSTIKFKQFLKDFLKIFPPKTSAFAVEFGWYLFRLQSTFLRFLFILLPCEVSCLWIPHLSFFFSLVKFSWSASSSNFLEIDVCRVKFLRPWICENIFSFPSYLTESLNVCSTDLLKREFW